MRKQVFFYFLSIFIIIQVAFYLSNGLEREQERKGFQACWNGSRIPGRPTWREHCSDPSWSERMKDFLGSTSNR